MYHLYEKVDSQTGRLLVLSEDQWCRMTVRQRENYQLRAGGFRTGLEAVMGLVKLSRIGARSERKANVGRHVALNSGGYSERAITQTGEGVLR